VKKVNKSDSGYKLCLDGHLYTRLYTVCVLLGKERVKSFVLYYFIFFRLTFVTPKTAILEQSEISKNKAKNFTWKQ